MTRLVWFSLLLAACMRSPQTQAPPPSQTESNAPRKRIHATWQQLLHEAEVTGCILIYDHRTDSLHSNDFSTTKLGHLPASTFKIPNSIIALETGVLASDSSMILWDGEPRYMESWEADMTLRQAFHRSCLPCYQDIARQVGYPQMAAQVRKLDYGHMDVDSSNYDSFWVVGRSLISPMEQIDFLRRFYYSNLSISARTEAIMKRMIVREKTDRYRLSGKTGWSIQGDEHNGWFVGYAEKGGDVYFFATNIDPTPAFDMDGFAQIRVDLTKAALEDIIRN